MSKRCEVSRKELTKIHSEHLRTLRIVLKAQIRLLVEQLSNYAGEEAVLLSASLSDGSFTHIGTKSGELFFNTHGQLKEQFVDFCMTRRDKGKGKGKGKGKKSTAASAGSCTQDGDVDRESLLQSHSDPSRAEQGNTSSTATFMNVNEDFQDDVDTDKHIVESIESAINYLEGSAGTDVEVSEMTDAGETSANESDLPLGIVKVKPASDIPDDTLDYTEDVTANSGSTRQAPAKHVVNVPVSTQSDQRHNCHDVSVVLHDIGHSSPNKNPVKRRKVNLERPAVDGDVANKKDQHNVPVDPTGDASQTPASETAVGECEPMVKKRYNIKDFSVVLHDIGQASSSTASDRDRKGKGVPDYGGASPTPSTSRGSESDYQAMKDVSVVLYDINEIPTPASTETPEPVSSETPMSISDETPMSISSETPMPVSSETQMSVSSEIPMSVSSETPKQVSSDNGLKRAFSAKDSPSPENDSSEKKKQKWKVCFKKH